MQRELTVEVNRPGFEVSASGRFDSSSCDRLRTALQEAADIGDGDLVLHAEGLEIWGAAALGVLLGIAHRARRTDRRLVLTGLAPRELRLVRASALHRAAVVEIDPSGQAGRDAATDRARTSIRTPRQRTATRSVAAVGIEPY